MAMILWWGRISWQSGYLVTELLTTWHPQSTGGPEALGPVHRHGPVTCSLQTVFNFYHLLIMPSNYEFINGLICLWNLIIQPLFNNWIYQGGPGLQHVYLLREKISLSNATETMCWKVIFMIFRVVERERLHGHLLSTLSFCKGANRFMLTGWSTSSAEFSFPHYVVG